MFEINWLVNFHKRIKNIKNNDKPDKKNLLKETKILFCKKVVKHKWDKY